MEFNRLFPLRPGARALRVALAWVLAVAVLPPAARSAEGGDSRLLNLSLEQLGSVKIDTVFAASKFSEKVTDAPSSVSIITRQEIQQFGYRTLGDVLQATRGFDVTYDRNYNYTGVRGFNRFGDYGSKVLLLVDGHRMNDMIFDSVPVGTEALLDVDLIERVEFIRGPGAALYGSNAFFGVISITTRRGADIGGVEAAASYSSYDTRTGRLTVGKKFANGVEVVVSGSGLESDGHKRLLYREFDAPETNRGVAERRDEDRAVNLLGSVAYRDFTLRGGFVSRKKDVPTASYGSIFNDLSNTLDERGFLELAYTHTTAGGWNFNARASFDSYHYQGYAAYAVEEVGRVINDDSADARWWGLEASASHTFFNRFRLTVGSEFRRSIDLSQGNYNTTPRVLYADVSSREEVFGAFADGSLEVARWLKVDAGVRYDRYASFGDTVNPRFGLIVQPVRSTTLKLLYGEAFRAPNAYELYYSGIGQGANPDLQPEKIRTAEIVAEHYFDKRWRASASVFENRISSLVTAVQNADGEVVFVNGGDARVRGAEVEVEGRWENGTLVRASYTHYASRDNATGQQLENSPRDTVRGKLALPIAGEKLSAGLELLYQSDRRTLLGNGTGDTWLLNATLLSRELRPGLLLSASVYNLLDYRYRIPGGPEHVQDTLRQDGRTARLKVSYGF